MRVKISNNKRGSYIVEAAIVLPMVILSVIRVVLIVMFFYSQVTEQSRMHIALRGEAGAATGRTSYTEGGPTKGDFDGEIYVDEGLVECRAYGKKYLMMEERGLLSEKKAFIVEGSWTAIDGPGYVRYMEFVKERGNEK